MLGLARAVGGAVVDAEWTLLGVEALDLGSDGLYGRVVAVHGGYGWEYGGEGEEVERLLDAVIN